MNTEITKPGDKWMLELFTKSGEFVRQQFFDTKESAEAFAEEFVFTYGIWNDL